MALLLQCILSMESWPEGRFQISYHPVLCLLAFEMRWQQKPLRREMRYTKTSGSWMMIPAGYDPPHFTSYHCLSGIYSPAPAVSSSSPISLAPAKQMAARDLLDSEDEEVQKAALPPSSAIIGNTKNQLDSTSQSLNKTRMEREQLDYNVTDSAAQLVQLESQLASAKAAYETETRLVKDLRDRQLEQAADIRTIRAQLIRAESDVSALRAEKAEVEGSVLRDKEEIRSLQRALKEASDAAVIAKAELERVKKDARQQKGLLAISRKQLSNAEAEREGVAKGIVTEKEELAQAYVEHAVVEAEYARSLASAPVPAPAAVEVASTSPRNVPIPETPERVASPALSTKNTNPFGHLAQGFSSPPPTVFPLFGPPAQTEESMPKGAPQAAETDPFSVTSDAQVSEPHPDLLYPSSHEIHRPSSRSQFLLPMDPIFPPCLPLDAGHWGLLRRSDAEASTMNRFPTPIPKNS
ncbi:hypothetical protein BS47DRAFT_164468 [Hydnum rufescens UP504]|uniref:Uncharacterized protein n=1 Tax=Hydnum rufescens UP504 TaxID=1448309 RepID=A0A9P6B8H2_9AGAM|nr:hypothetical protein BS47DRAFT_164468 [Hydnum rufescens UP504]